MQQEIQSARRGTEPGPPVDVGVYPPAEQADHALLCCADTTPQDKGGNSAGGNGRADETPCICGCPEAGNTGRHCSLPTGILIFLIRIYQKTLSPLLPECCRFYPSCSHYAVEALRIHGFMRGFVLMVWRVLRCNPWCRGGYDPVPPPKSGKSKQ